MINDKNFKQEGGESSTNYQASVININSGMSRADTKELFLELFKANFINVREETALIVRQRVEEFLDELLNKFNTDKPIDLNKLKDPDVQYVIYNAQKEYARTGDKDLEEVLINLLTQRIDEEQRNLRQIVLNEALTIAPILTSQQLDILAIVFLTHYTKNQNVESVSNFQNYLRQYFVPFISSITKINATYTHLEYTGTCGTFGITQDNLSSIFKHRYPGLFSKGFSLHSLLPAGLENLNLNSILVQCINNSDLLQFNALDEDVLKSKTYELGYGEQEFHNMKNLMANSTMNIEEADIFLGRLVPEMSSLIDTWRNSSICALNPTSVGIALAASHVNHKIGIRMDLSIWIQ